MTVYTYDPAKRDEVVGRRRDKGPQVPAGMKLIGEWSYLGGGRVFRLVEANDPLQVLAASHPWNDVGKIEVYPVLEVDKVIQAYGAMK